VLPFDQCALFTPTSKFTRSDIDCVQYQGGFFYGVSLYLLPPHPITGQHWLYDGKIYLWFGLAYAGGYWRLRHGRYASHVGAELSNDRLHSAAMRLIGLVLGCFEIVGTEQLVSVAGYTKSSEVLS